MDRTMLANLREAVERGRSTLNNPISSRQNYPRLLMVKRPISLFRIRVLTACIVHHPQRLCVRIFVPIYDLPSIQCV